MFRGEEAWKEGSKAMTWSDRIEASESERASWGEKKSCMHCWMWIWGLMGRWRKVPKREKKEKKRRST